MNGSEIWTVTAEFLERDDALALVELARELGIESKLGYRSVNKNNSPVRDTRVGKLILGSMQPGRSYGYDHFQPLLQDAGYMPQSAGPTLSQLTQQGDLRRIASGVYELPRSVHPGEVKFVT